MQQTKNQTVKQTNESNVNHIGKHPFRCFRSQIHSTLGKDEGSQKERRHDSQQKKEKGEKGFAKSFWIPSVPIRPRCKMMDNTPVSSLPTEGVGEHSNIFKFAKSHRLRSEGLLQSSDTFPCLSKNIVFVYV